MSESVSIIEDKDTIKQLVTSVLCTLLESCEYGELKEEMIRDRIVVRINCLLVYVRRYVLFLKSKCSATCFVYAQSSVTTKA